MVVADEQPVSVHHIGCDNFTADIMIKLFDHRVPQKISASFKAATKALR
jgi:hypothetical protein